MNDQDFQSQIDDYETDFHVYSEALFACSDEEIESMRRAVNRLCPFIGTQIQYNFAPAHDLLETMARSMDITFEDRFDPELFCQALMSIDNVRGRSPYEVLRDFPTLELNMENEAAVRDVIFRWWTKRWISRREKLLSSKKPLSTNKRPDRCMKSPLPHDLSGACKIVSQLSLIVFGMDGLVISNRRHAFVVLNGLVYDMNRDCEDVQSMLRGGYHRHPYEIDWENIHSTKIQSGMSSWNEAICALAEQVKNESERLGLKQSNVRLTDLPAWIPMTYPKGRSSTTAWGR